MRLPATVRDKCEISLGPRQTMRIPRTVPVREGFTRPKVDPPYPAPFKAGRGSKGDLSPRTSLYREGKVRDPSGELTGSPDRRPLDV